VRKRIAEGWVGELLREEKGDGMGVGGKGEQKEGRGQVRKRFRSAVQGSPRYRVFPLLPLPQQLLAFSLGISSGKIFIPIDPSCHFVQIGSFPSSAAQKLSRQARSDLSFFSVLAHYK